MPTYVSFRMSDTVISDRQEPELLPACSSIAHRLNVDRRWLDQHAASLVPIEPCEKDLPGILRPAWSNAQPVEHHPRTILALIVVPALQSVFHIVAAAP